MGLFGKKEVRKMDELPELPPLPELPALPEMPAAKPELLPSSLPVLPSFPSSISAERFSQAAIKQAVSEPEEHEEEDVPAEFDFSNAREGPRTLEITGFSEAKPDKKTAKAEPLFVRIDKFEDALNDFAAIKKKVAEIERMLRNIKDVKAKEEAELAEWEREMEALKAKIDGIDRGIFDRI